MRFLPTLRFLPSRRFSATQGILLGLALALLPLAARAATEAELRAAVIYNIARFVQWPQSSTAGANFDICTVGNNTIAEALTALQGKSLNGLPTAIRPVRRDYDLAGCRVLYIAPHESVRMTAIAGLLAKNNEPALTISDAPSFLALGGMVQLIVVEERQRFSINQELAEQANLNINAKLLQLALPRD